jgi:hypothetical protein
MRRSSSAQGRRRGAVTPWFVVVFPLLLAAFSVAVEVSSLHHRQLELKTSAEAAALAGAAALVPVDDALFQGDSPAQAAALWPRLEREARAEARLFARLNLVRGDELELGEGEIAFEQSGGGPESDSRGPVSPYVPGPDRVRVEVFREGVGARASALVDRHVVGFKVQGSSHRLAPNGPPAVPLTPFAIDAREWRRAIVERQGGDDHCLEHHRPRKDKKPVANVDLDLWGDGQQEPEDEDQKSGRPKGDGIREIKLVFGQKCEKVTPLYFTDAGDLARQVISGLTRDDLHDQPLPGQLLLQPGVNLPTAEVGDLEALAKALRGIAGQKRVWLLGGEQGDGEIEAAGFVAARVMAVEFDQKKGRVEVVLQPTLLVTPDAVTAPTPGRGQPAPFWNPYVCKVRLER